MKYTIDAQNKKMGRVATEVAVLLMGKNDIGFSRNAMPEAEVTVVNVSKLSITEAKTEQTTYKRYSGYPGGLKEETLGALAARKGYADVFRKTVSGMLPKNKLRSRMLKNLTISE